MKPLPKKSSATKPVIRCAIYTRKSTEEGLEQEFNSLDAQRESAEAFIKSQAHEGWQAVATTYDDGGFTGGNMDRPALKRLMADMEAGKINCVVVYKVDRLSRSLLDFSRLMELFDRKQIAFVSVTQQFNTATSMGRLILNVLFSFAQFEREMISERTRDKMGAARRKGKYVGGVAMLGYDVDHTQKKLVLNEEEASRVREIFELYLAEQSMLPVVQELARRGWTHKQRLTLKGVVKGGKPFSKTSLHKLLTDVAYLGQVRYRDETYAGEHPAIIPPEIWHKVQSLLRRNCRTGGTLGRNTNAALLKGLLHCKNCDCAMTLVATSQRGTKKYRYYVCNGAQRNGWQTCPTKSIPAAEIERFVIDQIRGMGSDPALAQQTLAQATNQTKGRLAALEAERRGLEREQARYETELAKLATSTPSLRTTAKLAEVQERIAQAESRLHANRQEAALLGSSQLDETEALTTLAAFDPIWETLTPREQARIIQLLVSRVEYDGAAGKIAVMLNLDGLGSITEELLTTEAIA